MNFDGDLAGAQFGGDLFVEQPDSQRSITSRSRGVSDPYRSCSSRHLRLLLACGPVAVYRLVNRIQ